MKNSTFILALIVGLFLTFQPTDLFAQLTFTNANTSDGLGNNRVRGIFAEGLNVYAGTDGGLGISTDGGVSFINKTTANGLGGNRVNDVIVIGSTVYAGTNNGFSISTDGGASFINKTTADGLGDNFIWDIEVEGSTIYVGTEVGFSVSTDGGATFTTYTTADGLAHNAVRSIFIDGSTWYLGTDNRVTTTTDSGATFSISAPLAGGIFGMYVAGSTIYAGPNPGPLQVSTDDGATFSTLSGAGSEVYGVYVAGSNIYLATNASFNGFQVSTDGGASFTNYTTADGLGNIRQDNVFIDATTQTVYVATRGGVSKAIDTSLPALESSWSVADITTDCDSDGGTYDVCYTAADLEDAIGVDFNFSYPSQLSPVSENFITLKNLCTDAVEGDTDQIEVYSNTDNAGEVNVSVYFDFSAPLDAAWSGEGEFICFTFELSETWDGTASTHSIVTNDLVESYETNIGERTAEDATLEIITMIGQINVNGDESTPLVNGSAFNGTTEITTADENCTPDGRWTQGLNTDTDGGFSIAAGGSANVRITRNTSENDLSVIGGSDALRAVFIRLGLGDAPTLNELLAMDVNGDGFASAGDITNILRRSVGLIADYPTQAGEVASDWKFALSADMEVLEGDSYDWKTVPVLSQCMAVPEDACAETVEYDAILKGDVVSSWTSGSNFKTAAETSLIVDVAAKHSLEMETTHRIPVYAQDIESFFTLDLDLPFDAIKVNIEDVVLTEIGESYDIQFVWNTPEEGRLMMASYTIQEINTNEPLFEIVVSEDITGVEFGAGTSYFNGIASNVEVIESTTVGIEDILGGSNSLTAIQNIHPNPANNVVMISYSKELTGDLEVQVMDLAGRIVAQQMVENQGRVSLDVSSIQNGLYVVTLSENGELKGRAKLMIAK